MPFCWEGHAMSNRLINTLNGRMWRELSRNPLRPAVLRELFKRVTKTQKQPGERNATGGCHDRDK
ncbi:hypothetical protein RIMD111065_29580 [Aeromonas hydrophila]|nr:hypothetical protein RIMD111065_29580 [Aeromonas hydrophila]